jgi:Right handed beta helix region
VARRALLVFLGLALLAPAAALAHIERASYWPDPAADCSIKPCTGGKVPTARSLASALAADAPGDTRVVCRPDSMKVLRASVRHARKHGYDIRPTDHRSLSAKAGARLLRLNGKLVKRCRFQSVQDAVDASRNNDRIVIMPGLYTEPKSRAAKTNDPACDEYRVTNDKGSSGAVSYAYQLHCPNDQNLIAVLGRDIGDGKDPETPLEDRHGIPNLGPCIRCNLQMEGSGVNADDVIVDAGRVTSGDKGPRKSKKDVGIRVDRADGFVLRNIKVRHAREHDIYVLESDGYLLDRFKTYWGGEYGVLTFVEDHGLMKNCEAAGSGDSGLYPGAGAETGAQREPGTPFRYSQRITRCDSHHNAGGYSGTDGNATHVDHNNFYDNALGFTTDVFTAPGHPGFPQDSDLVEYNNFYDNNYNPYGDQGKADDIQPSVPVPVGTGLWIAGGNDNIIRFNRFYDNYRRGAMLFAVPDATVCGPGIGQEVTGCDPGSFSTSYRNQFYGNIMGVSPAGEKLPNGQDFWWDNFAGNTGNCWWDNTTAPGAELNNAPASLPSCSGGKAPEESVGTSDFGNELELVSCFAAVSSRDYSEPCPWFETPARPRTRKARVVARRSAASTRAAVADPAVKSQLCAVYRDRPVACAGL